MPRTARRRRTSPPPSRPQPSRPPPLLTIPPELKFMIMDYMSSDTVSKTCRIHPIWHDIAEYYLYSKDIARESPTAILWASWGGEEDPTGSYVVNLKVLNRFREQVTFRFANEPDTVKAMKIMEFIKLKVNAVHVHSDGTFATALHFAAARGRLAVVRDLLQYGADVDAKSSGVQAFKSLRLLPTDVDHDSKVIGRLRCQIRPELTRAQWLPLMAPLLLQHYDVAQALLDRKASPILSQPAITAFHVMAATPDDDFHDGYSETGETCRRRRCMSPTGDRTNCCRTRELYLQFFDTATDHLNVPLPNELCMPLHLAVKHGNELVFDKLIEHGADPNRGNVEGFTPLHEAVDGCRAELMSPWRREVWRKYIDRLLDEGANPNALSVRVGKETPLMCVLPVWAVPWTAPHAKDMAAILNTLIDRGADPNMRAHRGRTVIHVLDNLMRACIDFRTRRYDGMPITKFLKILCGRGGDINSICPPGNTTLLGQLISGATDTAVAPPNIRPKRQWEKFKMYLRLLLKRGARVCDAEAGAIFWIWLRTPWLRNCGFDAVDQCHARLSQDVVNAAYLFCVEQQDVKLWNAIASGPSARLPAPTNGSLLVMKALKECKQEFFRVVRDNVSFDPEYTTRCDDTYLHVIVQKARVFGYTRLSTALDDARFFVERGTMVSALDMGGKNAIQCLREHGDDFATDLRLYLLDERDRQLGQY
ncbi:ankyrin repeat-containing protein [Purpureocillium lavendulum]|uniref:Ankyrin repeat-containing protein n=1 Tax=Purpureocillium lavendulum TaxID=1247861 RepID=A0AB34FSA8_9HYPO|nr:ankyrin repeat-containing protein [Purpureocillium lavendulum]